jgi:hypothetical protein
MKFTRVFWDAAQHYIPEDSKLHTHRRENLKSHMQIRIYYVHTECPTNEYTIYLLRNKADIC